MDQKFRLRDTAEKPDCGSSRIMVTSPYTLLQALFSLSLPPPLCLS